VSSDFQVVGRNEDAPFTLKVHRGEGMALLAMDWRAGRPPDDFVGFAIQYREPGGDRLLSVQNRLGFAGPDGRVRRGSLATTVAPVQKFRWVHFPRNADLAGDFRYRVSPVFMNDRDELSYGETQEVAVGLRRETYPGALNVAFTRGFVSSQAFVDRYESKGPISTLLPAKADEGLAFTPTHPEAADALDWMGFEARGAVLEVLDQAIADARAAVRVVAYDLNEPEVVTRLERLGARLKVIIDDSEPHGDPDSAESQAEARLVRSAGRANVKRQHMGNLQHNKTVVVDGPRTKAVVWGSTNLSWRGFFVQANNAIVVRGATAVSLGMAAFEAYWEHDDVAGFGGTTAVDLADAGVAGVDARVAFSPHTKRSALLATVARDIAEGTTSSLLYSLAFLYQTSGAVRDAIAKVTEDDRIFVYGISDRKVGGLTLHQADGNPAPVYAKELGKDAPEPFRSEPTGGTGTRMHHKFVVIDFDKPTARVYAGSYNFSRPADTQNGENLLVVRDRRIATAYAVEALRIFDHYRFRVAQRTARRARTAFTLAKPPRAAGDLPWWDPYWSRPDKVRDREMFA
jgi:phosphatidylserine/phosphatidylglycerophosphate/cardiolipin synthase-like enzyme